VFISIAALLALIVTLLRFKRGQVGRGEVILWLLLWASVAVLVWNPAVTNLMAGFLGVGRGADAIFYISIIVLFLSMFKLYGKLENLEHKLSELVKKIALGDLDEKK
jgi:hypothetical protein